MSRIRTSLCSPSRCHTQSSPSTAHVFGSLSYGAPGATPDPTVSGSTITFRTNAHASAAVCGCLAGSARSVGEAAGKAPVTASVSVAPPLRVTLAPGGIRARLTRRLPARTTAAVRTAGQQRRATSSRPRRPAGLRIRHDLSPRRMLTFRFQAPSDRRRTRPCQRPLFHACTDAAPVPADSLNTLPSQGSSECS